MKLYYKEIIVNKLNRISCYRNSETEITGYLDNRIRISF